MKYVKPNAEVIRIENEDIITGSCMSQGQTTNNGSLCISAGDNNAPNNYENMVNSGYCVLGSQGVMGGANILGSHRCSFASPGVMCSQTPGKYTGNICAFGSGIDQSNNCRSIGANSLGDSDY